MKAETKMEAAIALEKAFQEISLLLSDVEYKERVEFIHDLFSSFTQSCRQDTDSLGPIAQFLGVDVIDLDRKFLAVRKT